MSDMAVPGVARNDHLAHTMSVIGPISDMVATAVLPHTTTS